MQRRYRRYDHRIKNMIAESGDPYLFPDLAIPLSTAREWIKRGPQKVVTILEIGRDEKNLLGEIQSLKKDLNTLKVEQELTIKTFRLFGFQIQYQRLPSEESKTSLLQMILDAVRTIGLDRALNTIGLSRARWSLWLGRSKNCQLADESSCPKTLPQRLTSPEVRAIKELVTDPELRHFSISSLSLYAKRIGKVFASTPTWSRIIREYDLNRSGKRIYPEKPREGIPRQALGGATPLEVILGRWSRECYPRPRNTGLRS